VAWKVLWELPLAHFNPRRTAAEASYVASIGGDSLVGWTIGNEPDLYVKSMTRTLPWGYVNYFRQWNQTRAAVERSVPSIGFVGPETCCNPVDFGSFAGDARREVSALSLHFYSGSRTHLTAHYLLGPVPDRKLTSLASSAWQDSAQVDHLPLFVTETNTFPAGGVFGVSDTFAAGLWLVDFLFDALNLHISQADVQQSGGDGAYNPVGPSGRANAIYYGMLFFHSVVGPASRFLGTRLTTSANLTAYAVSSENSGLNVVVINKSAYGKAATVEVHPDAIYRYVRFFRLAATSLEARASGVTLAGARVSAQGTWRPRLTTFPLRTRLVTIAVPAGSAVCIEFRSRRK
jgi:hypothetical protein